jgi:hypothetical protein
MDAELGCEVFRNRQHVIRIRTKEGRTVYLDCEDQAYKESMFVSPTTSEKLITWLSQFGWKL